MPFTLKDEEVFARKAEIENDDRYVVTKEVSFISLLTLNSNTKILTWLTK